VVFIENCNLRVCNIVMTGSVDIKKRLTMNDFDVLMHSGWDLINENRSPILNKRFVDKGGVNLYANGKFVIFGLKNEQDGKDIALELETQINNLECNKCKKKQSYINK